MALQYELAGSQIDGTRGYQEDAFLITHLTDKDGNPAALVIVADGMGGHAAGNVASNMAVQAFNKHVSANYPSDNLAEVLRECVHQANKSIKETVAETPALSGMGCTMVVGLLENNKLWWASVGDSHIYVIRNKELIKKNDDHSYGGFLDRMAAAGTPVEQEDGLSRNMLMSAVMGEEINEIDVPEEGFELEQGDRILICSDGMDTLSAGKIIQYSEWSESTKECADALMQAVEDVGMPKQDNTTAVVVNVSEKEEVVAAAPEAVASAATQSNDSMDDTAEIMIEAADEEPGIETEDIYEEEEEDEEEGSNAGKLISIAAVVIIAIAVGGYFMFAGKEPASGSGSISVSDADTMVDENDVDEMETGLATGDDEDVATVKPEVTITTADTTAAKTEKSASDSKEFNDTLKDGSSGPTMIRIPAGSYDMGSPGSSRHTDERPRHKVKMRAIAVSQQEITFEQYDKFIQASGRKSPDSLYMDRATHPVIFVTWDDAYYYVKWLSEQTGYKYRLPSESQWEYFAGTGKRSPFWWGFKEEAKRAHCFGCGSGFDPRKPTKIGSFGANPFGLYDTAGNVAEWVHDCWHENYKNAPAVDEVWEGGDCAYRVARGGSYSSPPQSIRHTKRDKFKSDSAYDHIGIRVIRELD